MASNQVDSKVSNPHLEPGISPPINLDVCRVCGDKATRSRFRAQTCKACKSFFRRTIRATSQYSCRGDRNCSVTKTTRNRCQYCRLQKCFFVGMKNEAAFEEDMMRTHSSPAVAQEGWVPPPGLPSPQVFLATLPAQHPGFNTQFVSESTNPFILPQPGVPYVGMHQHPTAGFGVVYQTGNGSAPQVERSSQLWTPSGPLSSSSFEPPAAQYPAQVPAQQVPMNQGQPQVSVPQNPGSLAQFPKNAPGDSTVPSQWPLSNQSSPINQIDNFSSSGSSSSSIMGTKVFPSVSSSSGIFSLSEGSEVEKLPSNVSSRKTSFSSLPDTSSTLSENASVGKGKMGGTDSEDPMSSASIPEVQFDWDCLIKAHEECIKTPSQTKTPSEGTVGVQSILQSGRRSFLYFVDWIKHISAFKRLPPEARTSCLRSCWITQAIMNVFYRTFIVGSSGNIVTQSGLEIGGEHMQHPLIAMGISKMKDAMRTFTELQVDYKEFLCLRLMCLFNPDAPDLKPHTKDYIQTLRENLILTIEDHCAANPIRFDKMLLLLSNIEVIGQEMAREVELKREQASADFNEDFLKKLLL